MSPTNSVSPREHGPRLVARARVSISANAVCSGRWPGVCSGADHEDAEHELPAVVERLVRRTRRRASRWMWIVAPGRRREPPVARRRGRRGCASRARARCATPEVAGEAQVLVDLEARVDDRRDARVLVADQVGGAAEVVVGDLAEDHGPSSPTRRPRAGVDSRQPSRRSTMRAQEQRKSRLAGALARTAEPQSGPSRRHHPPGPCRAAPRHRPRFEIRQRRRRPLGHRGLLLPRTLRRQVPVWAMLRPARPGPPRRRSARGPGRQPPRRRRQRCTQSPRR